MPKLLDINLCNALNHFPGHGLADCISNATQQLVQSRVTMDEYNQAIERGALISKTKWSDDARFEKENPGHPLGAARFDRIRSADFFWQLSGAVDQAALPRETMNQMIKSLFDCSPTVRHQLTRALGRWRTIEARRSFENLMSMEKESEWVCEAANEALNLLDGRITVEETRWLRDPSSP